MCTILLLNPPCTLNSTLDSAYCAFACPSVRVCVCGFVLSWLKPSFGVCHAFEVFGATGSPQFGTGTEIGSGRHFITSECNWVSQRGHRERWPLPVNGLQKTCTNTSVQTHAHMNRAPKTSRIGSRGVYKGPSWVHTHTHHIYARSPIYATHFTQCLLCTCQKTCHVTYVLSLCLIQPEKHTHSDYLMISTA